MADVITRLKVESTEYDSKIKRASQGLLQMEQACRKVGGTLAILEKDELEFVKGLGKMETVSKDARGQLNELTKAFTDLSLQYKRLTDEEKQGDFGKALSASLDQLKTRIQDTKKDLADVTKEINGTNGKFGEFGSIIDGIGHKMGVSANITELLTSKTALMYAGIGAGIAILGKATKAWADYNSELARQDQITTVTTGLKGDAADQMTDSMRALSQTYNVDFRESINAANTLMTQFGVTGDQAIQLLKDGMQGMILGDGGKLLSMIQQFAPAFVDAGISADKLIAIIHNSEGGLFSEQNMNAILMGIKNIRLMTKSTSDALAKLGIDGQKMSQRMSEGSMTVFEALHLVAKALEGAKAGSQEAGQVMQYVFGRQGAMQGMKLARAIAELNLNLEETKKQTGDLGDAYTDLQAANEKLNVAIRECFGYDGWEEMTIGIKTGLIEALSAVINVLAEIKNTVGSVVGAISGAINNLTGATDAHNKIEAKRLDIIENSGASEEFYSGTQKNINERIAALKKSKNKDASYDNDIAAIETLIAEKTAEIAQAEADKAKADKEKFKNASNLLEGVVKYGVSKEMPSKDVLTKQDELKILQEAKEYYIQQANAIIYKVPTNTVPTTTPKGTSVTKELGPMQQVQKEISALTEEALTADEDRLEVIKKEIAALNEQLKVYKEIQDYVGGKEPDWSKLVVVGDRKAFEAEQMRRFDVELGISKNAFTEKNVSSFISDLKNQIQTADLGSELYNNLTKQLADANALSNLMQTAIKNGIAISQFNPQDLWSKVFGQNPGDYISDEQLEEIRKKIEEAIGKPIKLDLNSGQVNVENKQDKITQESRADFNKITGSLSTITGALQRIGVEIPEGFSKTLGVLQIISTITMAIQALTTVTATTSALKSIPIVGMFLHNGGVVHAANGWAGTVPGNSFSGDNVPAMLNSGEVVLTRAMASNLASQLSSNNAGATGRAMATIESDQIKIVLQNGAQSRGMTLSQYLEL